MRRPLQLSFLALALVLAAPVSQAAEPTDPVPDAAARYAPGTPAMVTAWQIAVQRWGTAPCQGQVALSWTPMQAGTNATSSWSNPVSAYGAADQNVSCRMTFSSTAPFDWHKFCTVVVHEVGHLVGHPHSDRPDDIMAEYYSATEPTCARTPDPTGYLPEGRGESSVASVMKVVKRRGKARASAVGRVTVRRATRR